MSENKQRQLDMMKRRKRTTDLNLLRHIVMDSSSWKSDSLGLNESLFEKTFGLAPLPSEVASPTQLNKALNYERVTNEITTRMRPLRPSGNTLRDQVKSLLPKNLGGLKRRELLNEEDLEDDEEQPQRESDIEEPEEVKSLSYALSRIVVERVPRATEWSVSMPGLDSLSAAILSIYGISRIVGQPVPWLYDLWSYMMEELKIEVLEHVLGSFASEFSWEDLAARLLQADKMMNKALGQDPNLDSSIAQPSPLSVKIKSWYRRIATRNYESEKLRVTLRREISDELAMLKGFNRQLQNEIDVRSISVAPLDVFALRPDGPVANKYEKLLQLFRREMNILRYAPLPKLCLNLARTSGKERLTASDVERASHFKGRTSYYALQKLEHFLHERYIPAFRKLGLRYRYIFTPLQRTEGTNAGLIEKMILTEKKIRGCTVYIEPSQTRGPDVRFLPEGAHELVVEDEIVSMNLDYYNVESGLWNLESIGDLTPIRKKRRRMTIEYGTSSIDNRPYSLTERQTELLSILWRFEGSRTERKWLLEQVKFPSRTASRMLHQLMQCQVLNRAYLPALEFCGLPDGLMAAANCHDRKSRDTLINELIGRLPFTRLLFGDSNDIVAHIRTPSKKSDQVAGILRDIMRETSDSLLTARLKTSHTYRMSVLHQIRDGRARGWKDIWLTEKSP